MREYKNYANLDFSVADAEAACALTPTRPASAPYSSSRTTPDRYVRTLCTFSCVIWCGPRARRATWWPENKVDDWSSERGDDGDGSGRRFEPRRRHGGRFSACTGEHDVRQGRSRGCRRVRGGVGGVGGQDTPSASASTRVALGPITASRTPSSSSPRAPGRRCWCAATTIR